jgi:predicted nucleic acid-binding protein
MVVVADTSPINYLVLIQQTMLLPTLYTRVVIPPAVYEELQRSSTPEVVRQWVARPPAWFMVQRPQRTLPARQFPKLGAGEREAIPLAQDLNASALLTDDGDGRKEAARRSLAVTGTLGILEIAAIRCLISLPPVIAQLQATTFHASPELFAAVLARDAERKRQPSRRQE